MSTSRPQRILQRLLAYALARYLEEAFPGRELCCTYPLRIGAGDPIDLTREVIKPLVGARLLLLHLYTADTQTYELEEFEQTQHKVWQQLEAADDGLNIRYCFNIVDDLERRPLGFQRAAYILEKSLLVSPSALATNVVQGHIPTAISLADGVRLLSRSEATGLAPTLQAICERFVRCGADGMDSLLLLVWQGDRLILLAGVELVSIAVAIVGALSNAALRHYGGSQSELRSVQEKALLGVVYAGLHGSDANESDYNSNMPTLLRPQLNMLLSQVLETLPETYSSKWGHLKMVSVRK